MPSPGFAHGVSCDCPAAGPRAGEPPPEAAMIEARFVKCAAAGMAPAGRRRVRGVDNDA
jgi:hypothetical protein